MGSAAASRGGTPIGVAIHMNPDHEQTTLCQTENESVRNRTMPLRRRS